jgi:nitrite reductase/ring-hydroxylating ferredoxin subunit
VRAFSVDEQEIAVVRVEGKLYAFSNICTHNQDYLTNGYIFDRKVVCGSHEATYDLESGAVLYGPALDSLSMFKVREEGGEVQLEWAVEDGEGFVASVDPDDEEHRFRAQFVI